MNTSGKWSYEAVMAAHEDVYREQDETIAIIAELAREARSYLSGRRFLDAQEIVRVWYSETYRASNVRSDAILAEAGWTVEEYSAQAAANLRAWLAKRDRAEVERAAAERKEALGMAAAQ